MTPPDPHQTPPITHGEDEGMVNRIAELEAKCKRLQKAAYCILGGDEEDEDAATYWASMRTEAWRQVQTGDLT